MFSVFDIKRLTICSCRIGCRVKWIMLADLRAHSVKRCDSQLVRTEGSQGVDLMASCGSLRAHVKQCESS